MHKLKYYILIPVFNEQKTIQQVVSELSFNYPEIHILIINDGSTDNTYEILDKINYSNLQIVHLELNQGKGNALRVGLNILSNLQNESVVIFMDADLEIPGLELKKIITAYEDNPETMAVFGSRFLEGNNLKKFGFFKVFINGFLTLFTNLIMQNKLTDMETAVKSFKTSLIKKLNLQGKRFEIEPEITLKLDKLNIRIIEKSISYNPRSKKEGKKMSIKGGIETLKYIFTFTLSRNKITK